MPANLPPQYVKLEDEYRREKDPQRKLELLYDMLREIPKHKGTDHLQGELKQKISRLKKEIKRKPSGAKRKESLDHIAREGVAQFSLVGPPNSGKSSILAAMSNARPEIADFPFTTRKPLPGMANYKGVQLQLVDLPPICTQFCESWVGNVVRTSDIALVVLSLGEDDLLEQFDDLTTRLMQSKVLLDNSPPPESQPAGVLNKKAIIVAAQSDRPDAEMRLEMLTEQIDNRFSIVPISAQTGQDLDTLRQAMFDILGKMRVYTKTPGKEPDFTDPVVLEIGSTVADAAREIHKDFARGLQFAKIWGPHTFDGQRVKGDYVVNDGDVLEFHI